MLLEVLQLLLKIGLLVLLDLFPEVKFLVFTTQQSVHVVLVSICIVAVNIDLTHILQDLISCSLVTQLMRSRAIPGPCLELIDELAGYWALYCS